MSNPSDITKPVSASGNKSPILITISVQGISLPKTNILYYFYDAFASFLNLSKAAVPIYCNCMENNNKHSLRNFSICLLQKENESHKIMIWQSSFLGELPSLKMSGLPA